MQTYMQKSKKGDSHNIYECTTVLLGVGALSCRHAHKSTVMSMKWNKNGNWFLTASRDHLLKLFDIRNMKSEFQTFKGHQREATGR